MTGKPLGEKPEGFNAPLHVSRFTFFDYLLALLSGICAFVLYLRTLAPGLLFGDSAEFQMAAWLGGFVHPTGYPLYLLVGHIWTHLLSAGDPAWRMNLLSAVWGAVRGWAHLPVGASHRRAMATTRRRFIPGSASGSSLAALAFAVTPTFWGQAVIAEVYTLNAAFVAAVLLGLTTWAAQLPDRQNITPLYWTAAIYGLSLTHHRSMLLLLPAMTIYLWLVSQTGRDRAGEPDSPSPRWPESWRWFCCRSSSTSTVCQQAGLSGGGAHVVGTRWESWPQRPSPTAPTVRADRRRPRFRSVSGWRFRCGPQGCHSGSRAAP